MTKEDVLKHIERIIDEKNKSGYEIRSFGGRHNEIYITFKKIDKNKAEREVK
ncbi:hypothetical protein KEC48_03410 [Clostridium sp. C1]|uniref:hypothetical protein n=1 Tax=Clostridium sp. C1 TaxID=1155388 RepID=UPI001BA7AC2C|nr:hypothetical protein [Clostridium sp. C1]QUN13587.1 hypothetical protein KEC48_03410 [Clostridium sp. C1]